MDKRFGYYVFGGALIGAMFGLIWAAGNNPLMGIGIGALVGVVLGWFVAAAALEKSNKEK